MLLMIFLALWTQDPTRYAQAMQRSAEATYVGSDLKPLVEQAEAKARETAPVLATIAPAAYAATVRHEVKLSTSRVTPLPGTVTTYDATRSQISVRFTWSF